MSIVAKIKQVLRTDGFLRQESKRWSRDHFQGNNLEIAQTVAYALVTQLGVDFKQLNTNTNIVVELKADEYLEWEEIQMCLEEELGFYFDAKPEFAGRTISELVNFISQPCLAHLKERPKRKIFSAEDWCLAGCLRAHSS